MSGNSREMITLAERRFPVRIRIAVPPSGLGQRHTQITARLDENCGADGWAMTPWGTRGVLDFWNNGARRVKNDRLRRDLRSGMTLLARSPFGGYGYTYKWPRENHDKVIEKITRGLYYHHFGEILRPAIFFEIIFLDKLDAELEQTVLSMRRCNVGGAGRFAYAYGRLAEEPQVSMWIYQFYMRHWALAITKPEFCDIGAGEFDIIATEQPRR
jgi:hypothetical protein